MREPERGRSGGTEALVLRLHNIDSCRPQIGEREGRENEREARGAEVHLEVKWTESSEKKKRGCEKEIIKEKLN